MPGSIIAGGARTPIGKLAGALSAFSATDLGGMAIKAALEKAGVAGGRVRAGELRRRATAGRLMPQA